MWSIGVTYGLSPETLKVAPPDVLVDTPQEIATVFE
jgi:phosphoglycolate phosphatase-like HAD superfamily hydrolase